MWKSPVTITSDFHFEISHDYRESQARKLASASIQVEVYAHMQIPEQVYKRKYDGANRQVQV